MTDPTPRLREGVLGRFWLIDQPTPGQLDEADAVHGSLRLLDDGVLVRTILPDISECFAERPVGPRWLFGIAEGGGTVIVPTLTREAHQLALFSSHTSVRTLRGPAVIAQVGEPFGPRISWLQVKLPHPEWAGLHPLAQTVHFDDHHRAQGLDIQLRGSDPIQCGRARTIEVELGGGWNQAYGDTDQHHSQIWTSLDVSTRAVRPRQIGEHVDIAQRVQDLLSLAYDRQLTAYSCRVRVEGAGGEAEPSWLWHHDLNSSPDRPAVQSEPPYFQLGDLGDATAITRWVDLTRRFPDTAEAVFPRTRLHAQTARLLQLGVAIEKYVGVSTKEGRSRGRPPAWTTRLDRNDTFAASVARHAGSAFAAFIGDPTKWGTAFTEAYNSAKHPYTAEERTPGQTLFYNLSAQVLLTCIMLDRAAGSRRPSTSMLADHRLQAMSEYARACS